MNKLIIFLVLLSCSCTKEKSNNDTPVTSTKADIGSNYPNQLASLLTNNEYVENKKTQHIYNSVIKGIRPDMPNDSLKKVLQIIHYWDQVYRDSLMEGDTWISDEVKRKKYSKEMSHWDKMNQRIVLHLFNNLGGWPDTKDMGNEASMAIWLVVHHNFDTYEFSQQILPYLIKAYYSDSVINKNMYAGLFDRVNYKVNGYSKYGTYGFHKDHYPDSVRNRINFERIRIGLDKL